MKAFVKNLLVYAGLVLLSACLAPLLYTFLPFKFKRILSRCLMLMTLGYIFYLVRVYQWDWKQFLRQIGFSFGKQEFQWFWKGAFAGGIFLFCFFILLCFLGMRESSGKSIWMLAQGISVAAIAALLIGVIEGVFFQGIIFRSMSRLGILPAFLFSSVIYAVPHFFHDASVFVDSTPTVVDSFRLMLGYFQVFLEPLKILPAFLGLLFFGLIQNGAFYKSPTILFPIGLHAGAVFIIKTGDTLTTRPTSISDSWLWGSELLYDGVAGWGFMALMGILVFWYCRRERGGWHVEKV